MYRRQNEDNLFFRDSVLQCLKILLHEIFIVYNVDVAINLKSLNNGLYIAFYARKHEAVFLFESSFFLLIRTTTFYPLYRVSLEYGRAWFSKDYVLCSHQQYLSTY